MNADQTERAWQTARRRIAYENKTLVMGILNATPDSFSDGGKFNRFDTAINQAELMIAEGADILDIGGESTRPNSLRVDEAEEIERVTPIIREMAKRFNAPISIDTTKAAVARAAIEAGAEIINDISGLRWDVEIGKVAAETKAGLILMHSRGTFETMHDNKYAEEILPEVIGGLRESVSKAVESGVEPTRIALDVGIGFGKKLSQNLELLAKLERICYEFKDFPVLVGTSRKSFIGKLLSDTEQIPAAPENRLHGTLSSLAIAIFNGANIVRVHDVRAAVETAKIADAIRNAAEF